MRKILIIIMLLIVSSATVAATKVNCKHIKLESENKNIILPGVEGKGSAKIYFVENISKESLWLDHPITQRSASAGWSSYVHAGKWSALIVNRKNFVLTCAIIKPGKVDYQNCGKAISICVPEKVVFDSKRKGSYWLAENQSWEDLLKVVEKRGIQFQ